MSPKNDLVRASAAYFDFHVVGHCVCLNVLQLFQRQRHVVVLAMSGLNGSRAERGRRAQLFARPILCSVTDITVSNAICWIRVLRYARPFKQHCTFLPSLQRSAPSLDCQSRGLAGFGFRMVTLAGRSSPTALGGALIKPLPRILPPPPARRFHASAYPLDRMAPSGGEPR